jgi:mono/diheme cytochrome c family protein
MHHLLRVFAGIAVAAMLGCAAEAAAQVSQGAAPASPPVDDVRPAPQLSGEARRGGELFVGTRRLTNHGPACLSCHTVAGLSRLEGGTFGPDLTRAPRHLGDGRGLAALLRTLPTPMMRATFQHTPLTPDEARALSAYLVQAESRGVESPPRSRIAAVLAVGTTGVAMCVLTVGFARRRVLGVDAPSRGNLR